MFITTKAEFVWDKDLKKYVEVHTEGYEYDGELALAQSPYQTFSQGAPTAIEVAQSLGIDTGSTEFIDEAIPYLYEYDMAPEQFGRLSAGADIGRLYGQGIKSLADLMQPTGSDLFADFGATKDARLRQDVYSDVGAVSSMRLLDFMYDAAGMRGDYSTGLIEYIRALEESRGSLFPRWSGDDLFLDYGTGADEHYVDPDTGDYSYIDPDTGEWTTEIDFGTIGGGSEDAPLPDEFNLGEGSGDYSVEECPVGEYWSNYLQECIPDPGYDPGDGDDDDDVDLDNGWANPFD